MIDRKNSPVFIYLRRVLTIPKEIFEKNIRLGVIFIALLYLKYDFLGIALVALGVFLMAAAIEYCKRGSTNDRNNE